MESNNARQRCRLATVSIDHAPSNFRVGQKAERALIIALIERTLAYANHHNSNGDAYLAAQLFQRLLAVGRKADINTLGKLLLK